MKTVSVVGDIILDETWTGDVERLSPEAPVPIILNPTKKVQLGGAGYVYSIIKNLIGKCQLQGVVGKDSEGMLLFSYLSTSKKYNNIINDAEQTTRKIRYYDSSGHMLLRIDKESFYDKQVKFNNSADIIVASDYGKGVLKDTSTIDFSKQVIVDTKKEFHKWSGAYLIKPNKKEFEQYFKHECTIPYIESNIPLWLQDYKVKYMLITLGSEGVILASQGGLVTHFPGYLVEVKDIVGAGDVVIAVIAAMLAQGKDLHTAIHYANYAASQSVTHVGLQNITKDNLPKTVFTNGCFDVLHVGHLYLLQQAKQFGTKLIVGINDDASIRRLKGEKRPINSVEDRKNQLMATGLVDEVLIFEEDTPYNLIEKVQPDIFVRAEDYNKQEIEELNLTPEVILIPLLKGFSSSKLLDKINGKNS